MRIGKVELKNNLLLAPLAGFTDSGFRSLCFKYGSALCCTEMVSVQALNYNNEATKILLSREENEKPCAVQIFGSIPELFYKAVKNPLLKDFDIIDINMGCPVAKVFKSGDGSALLNDKVLASELLSAAVEGADGRPVTVKMRVGINDFEGSVEFAEAMEKSGASAITVHGRTKIQMYSGKADLESIKNVKSAVKIPVIGNGDVINKDSFINMLEKTNVDAVMIGRGALGKPFIFSDILDLNYKLDLKNDIIYHIQCLLKHYSDRVTTNLIKKHICFYGSGRKNSKEIKFAVNNSININQIYDVLNLYF